MFGEISLSGDVRQVGRTDARLKEAVKLGFASALAPSGSAPGPCVAWPAVARLTDAVRRIGDGDWK